MGCNFNPAKLMSDLFARTPKTGILNRSKLRTQRSEPQPKDLLDRMNKMSRILKYKKGN